MYRFSLVIWSVVVQVAGMWSLYVGFLGDTIEASRTRHFKSGRFLIAGQTFSNNERLCSLIDWFYLYSFKSTRVTTASLSKKRCVCVCVGWLMSLLEGNTLNVWLIWMLHFHKLKNLKMGSLQVCACRNHLQKYPPPGL